MICPRCQAQLPDGATICRLCGAPIRQPTRGADAAPPAAPAPLAAGRGAAVALITRSCPTCQARVTVSTQDVRCPLCNVRFPEPQTQPAPAPAPAAPQPAHGVRGVPAGSYAGRPAAGPAVARRAAGVPGAANQAGHAAMDLEGVVFRVHDRGTERRDLDLLQVFAAILFLADFVVVGVTLGAIALGVFAVVLVLALIARPLRGMFGGMVPEAATRVLALPLATLMQGWRVIRSAFVPNDTDREDMREVELKAADKPQNDIFWIKGEVEPNTPIEGQQLRVWLQPRGLRRYFARGQYQEEVSGHPVWRPMRLRRQHRGLRWLGAWLVVNGAGAAFWYLFLRR